MYRLDIKTKFNEIKILVHDYLEEEVQEILTQPYVEDYKVDEYKEERDNKIKVLTKSNNKVYTNNVLKTQKGNL